MLTTQPLPKPTASTRAVTQAGALLLAVFLSSCGGGGGGSGGGLVSAQKPACPAARSAPDALELLNAARAAPRLCGTVSFAAAAPLAWDAQLEQAASAHAKDMATRNFFSHTNPDGVSASQRTVAAGYGPFTGENIGGGHANLDAAMQAWLASPGHCENIMNGAYKHYAVACSSSPNSEYGTYWTQSFGSKP